MEKTYNFWERLKSDTPVFFKRVQALGLGLATLGTSLTQIAGIPSKLPAILISTGSTLAIIAQFAVKQCEPITNNTDETDK